MSGETRISVQRTTNDQPPRQPPPRTRFGDAGGQSILRVRLNDPEQLTMGELGRLFRDLQAAVRSTADVIDRRPPRGSVRVTGFDGSSLEFLVEVFQWAQTVAELVGDTTVDIARELWNERGVTASMAAILLQLLSARKLAEHDLQTQTLLEVGQEAVVERQELRRSRRRRLQAERLARDTGMPVTEVEKAMRVFDAIDRSVNLMHVSGGGFIEARPSKKKVTIEPPN